MDHLAMADPQAARQLRSHVEGSGPIVHHHRLEALVDEVISALAVELSFGRTLADGIGRLLKGGTTDDLDRYLAAVKSALTKGPTLATLLARHLVPVLCCGDARLAERFERTTRTMLKKGTYTLKAPLETLSQLIEKRSLADADAFLDLLEATYARDISYNRTVYLTHVLPRAVGGFPPRRRLWQIRGLTHIMHTDESLVGGRPPVGRSIASGALSARPPGSGGGGAPPFGAAVDRCAPRPARCPGALRRSANLFARRDGPHGSTR